MMQTLARGPLRPPPKKRYGKRPERLFPCWTAEESKAEALMQFRFKPELVDVAAKDYDAVVKTIKPKKFDIPKPPSLVSAKRATSAHFASRKGIIA